jgi:hypothetical protein
MSAHHTITQKQRRANARHGSEATQRKIREGIRANYNPEQALNTIQRIFQELAKP